MTEPKSECTCPDDDSFRCIDGDVYGPCSSPDCYGVCEYEGYCTCPLHTWPDGVGKGDPHEPPGRGYP
jgi:hypothetical protein